MCNTTNTEIEIASLASRDAKASAPPTAAMENLNRPEACSSSDGATVAPDDHSVGEKRCRDSLEDLENWAPGMGLDNDAELRPQSQRSRLAATSLLFELLVRQTAIIRAHVLERHRQDQIERGISRQIAERHPLTLSADAIAHPRAKSIPCELASPPSDEEGAWSQEHAAACSGQSATLPMSKVTEEWSDKRSAVVAASTRGLRC